MVEKILTMQPKTDRVEKDNHSEQSAAMCCECLCPLRTVHRSSTEVCRRSCVPSRVPDSASFVLSAQRTQCLSCWSQRSGRPLEWRTVDTPSKVAPSSESQWTGSRTFPPREGLRQGGWGGRNSVCPLCCLQKNDLAAPRSLTEWVLDSNKLDSNWILASFLNMLWKFNLRQIDAFHIYIWEIDSRECTERRGA